MATARDKVRAGQPTAVVSLLNLRALVVVVVVVVVVVEWFYYS